METLTVEALGAVLRRVGVHAGDALLVHSAVQFLGKPADGAATYLEAIRSVIGKQGTLAVPTFNFGFCRGELFDPYQTPSVDMGVFSEYVRQHPEARRTQHPMQSLAILGKDAEEFAAIDTPGAFDDGSVFDLMIQRDYTLLLLGASIQAASLVHWSEQRYEVPYRYWKAFRGTVIREGDSVEAEYSMFVRDLTMDPQLDLRPIQDRLIEEGAWNQQALGYGMVARCSARSFETAADLLLDNDPWSLVGNRGELEAGSASLPKEV